MSEIQKPKATRQAFGEMLAELGSNTKIIVMDADLAKSTKSEIFAKKYPDRFFEMGIQEANMIGTAAGFALSGYIPFICSLRAFVTGRYDQIRMSVSYAEANVRIVGTHSGIGIGDDGHSQMGLEDLGMMRALPKMTVLQPCDEYETRAMVKFLINHDGPAYLRLTRQNLVSYHGADYQWKFGKFDILKKGKTAGNSGVALIGTGGTVHECILASEILLKKGIETTVVNAHSLKPFDNEGAIELARTHRLIVTVEDHYTTGGLGSAVCEALAQNGSLQTRVKRLGVIERFGESGEGPELYESFGISARKIAEAVE